MIKRIMMCLCLGALSLNAGAPTQDSDKNDSSAPTLGQIAEYFKDSNKETLSSPSVSNGTKSMVAVLLSYTIQDRLYALSKQKNAEHHQEMISLIQELSKKQGQPFKSQKNINRIMIKPNDPIAYCKLIGPKVMDLEQTMSIEGSDGWMSTVSSYVHSIRNSAGKMFSTAKSKIAAVVVAAVGVVGVVISAAARSNNRTDDIRDEY